MYLALLQSVAAESSGGFWLFIMKAATICAAILAISWFFKICGLVTGWLNKNNF